MLLTQREEARVTRDKSKFPLPYRLKKVCDPSLISSSVPGQTFHGSNQGCHRRERASCESKLVSIFDIISQVRKREHRCAISMKKEKKSLSWMGSSSSKVPNHFSVFAILCVGYTLVWRRRSLHGTNWTNYWGRTKCERRELRVAIFQKNIHIVIEFWAS